MKTPNELVALARRGQQALAGLPGSDVVLERFEALAELERTHVGLMVEIASKYVDAKYTGPRLALPALVEAGAVGLRRAIDRFDPDADYKFSTFATWWIRQAITQAIMASGGTATG